MSSSSTSAATMPARNFIATWGPGLPARDLSGRLGTQAQLSDVYRLLGVLKTDAAGS